MSTKTVRQSGGAIHFAFAADDDTQVKSVTFALMRPGETAETPASTYSTYQDEDGRWGCNPYIGSMIGTWRVKYVVVTDVFGNVTTVRNKDVYPDDENAADLSSLDFEFINDNDGKGPVVDASSVTVTPRRATTGEVVTISAKVTDGQGVSSVQVYLAPNKDATYNARYVYLRKGEGDTWTGTYTVQDGDPSVDTWQISLIYTRDVYGNASYLWNRQRSYDGGDFSKADFEIYGTKGDTEAPVADLSSLFFSPTRLSTEGTATVSMRVTDDLSGVSGVYVAYHHPTKNSMTSIYLYSNGDGTYSTTVKPQSSGWCGDPGHYRVERITLEDKAGNKRDVYNDGVSGGTGVEHADLSALEFDVVDASECTDLSSAQVTLAKGPFIYDGGEQTPDAAVVLDGDLLVNGRDYELVYRNNVNAGSATMEVRGLGAYCGATTKTFLVVPRPLSTVEMAPEEIAPVEFDGTAYEPAVSLRFGDTDLVQGTDFKVRNLRNDRPGTATVTVVGKGNYAGIRSIDYQLMGDISAAEVVAPNQVFTGQPFEPEVTVTLNGKTLKAGDAYEVSFEDNVNPGEATVIVTGVGAARGEATGTFQIDEPFCDVTPATPHYSDILWLYASSITTGWGSYPTRTFSGSGFIKRQDMAAFLYRLAGSPAYTPTAEDMAMFTDVTTSTPHCREIWWLASEGISTGWAEKDGTRTFRPANTVVRQDMAAFLYRMAGSPAYTPTAADRARFSDVTTSTPHHDEIWWLANTGVTTGFNDGTFRGMNKVQRQDMAAFLHRMADKALVKY